MVESAGVAVQLATPVGPVVAVVHVLAVQELVELAAAFAQAATGVGPVFTVAQVVAV